MTHYLIEFRFQGHAKEYVKTLIWNVSKKFKVKGVTRNHVVPHVSLFGPFSCRQERNMLKTVVDIASKYNLVPFTVSGFGHFRILLNKVVYVDISPSPELENLRRDLATALMPISYGFPNFDSKEKFHFHATIAFKDIDWKFGAIWKYLKEREEPNIKQNLLRITIIKNKKILAEYDLMQKKLLNRQAALSKREWNKTIEIMKKQI